MKCPSGKHGYAIVSDAVRVLQARRARRGVTGSLHFYRCDECRAWHLGRGQDDVPPPTKRRSPR
jgi:hypothetical protein